MHLVVAGLSHRTAPLELRERIALPPDDLPRHLGRLVAPGAGFLEGLLLSTCNRTEVYVRSVPGDPTGRAAEFLAGIRPECGDAVRDVLYVREGEDAVRHLFRVTAGLDSMVVGENEIARQVSDAYAAACRAGTAGPLLHRAVPRALQVGKQVRTETGLGRGAASVAGAAVALAERIFSDVSAQRVLAIGAGTTVATALRALSPGRGRLVVLNRTASKARALAEPYGGEFGGLDEIPRRLATADIVVAATSSPAPLVLREHVELAMHRRDEPLLVLDLGVPRDVEADARGIENVFVHDVDDLRTISDRAIEVRALEIPKAEAIVAGAVTEFRKRRREMETEPAIRALLDGLLRLRGDVLSEERAGSAESRAAAENATGRLVDKILRRLAPRVKDGTVGPREILDAFGISAAAEDDREPPTDVQGTRT